MNIQEQLNSLIRGNPLSVDTYLREVCKNEHISDTKASMHIYMLKLDGNNRPRTCDFCDYLINRIVDYCIPPSEISYTINIQHLLSLVKLLNTRRIHRNVRL